jgi:transposase
MAKYSFEFTPHIVQDYYLGVGGKRFLAKKYGITPKQVAVWKNIYKEFGTLGLQQKRQNTVYSTPFKINAGNLYLTSEFSYREVSNQININNPALITV